MPRLTLRVEGMEELRKGLRNISPQLGKELGKANKEIGVEVVGWSDRRLSAMRSRYGAYAMRRLKVKGSANQRRVIVTVKPGMAERGGKRHPVFGEWMPQSAFKKRVWPEPRREGYLVRPTVAEREPEIADLYIEAVGGLARRVIGE